MKLVSLVLSILITAGALVPADKVLGQPGVSQFWSGRIGSKASRHLPMPRSSIWCSISRPECGFRFTSIAGWATPASFREQ